MDKKYIATTVIHKMSNVQKLHYLGSDYFDSHEEFKRIFDGALTKAQSELPAMQELNPKTKIEQLLADYIVHDYLMTDYEILEACNFYNNYTDLIDTLNN